MGKVRAVFEKKGRARYISHLDLNRCMLRTFRRSKLPIWFTEGFNPHPYFSFALALSLGFESSCEILDFTLTEELPFDEIKERLNAVMPEGMKILSVSEQNQKITEIAKAEYAVELITESSDELTAEINSFMELDKILIEKKTKKGMKEVDLKPSVELTEVSASEAGVKLEMKLPAGVQTNYNPTLFIEALEKYAKTSFSTGKIVRKAILCENNEKFS